ncbi:MAG: thioredoxin domain-containing protein [Lewinella sp.]|nr:thioredoxin domain-containing protein [Lewinella sp.]
MRTAADDDFLSPAAFTDLAATLKRRFDTTHGGFGGAPKFPMSQSLELLLDLGLLTGDHAAIGLVEFSVRAMLNGGIYDQLGGGFSRYTVDAAWRVPHFEKMLYDNALLLRLLSKLQMRRPHPRYQAAIEQTVGWLKAEMLSPSGSFYAALDSDSEGEEGKFYVWSWAELEDVLSPLWLTQVKAFYGPTESGNWAEEHTNILYRPLAFPPSGSPEAQALAAAEEALRARRAERPRPSRDEKIILQWNALLVSGLCYAYRATGQADYRQLAAQALEALSAELFDGQQWYHHSTAGRRGQPAFLDDYAALLAAQLDWFELSQDFTYLTQAQAVANYVEQHFSGAEGDLYYLRPPLGNELPVNTPRFV